MAGSFMTRTEIPAGGTSSEKGAWGEKPWSSPTGSLRHERRPGGGRRRPRRHRGRDGAAERQPAVGDRHRCHADRCHVCTPAELTALRGSPPPSIRPSRGVAVERGQTNRQLGVPGARASAPLGRLVRWRRGRLPGRGSTFACDLPGPTPDAPAVILLHGLSATGALNWGPSLTTLNDQFRVVALDHRGHGGRRGPSRSRSRTAPTMPSRARRPRHRQAMAVGYSMGGPIAQLVWRRHPDRVRGLVLCATAADFRMSADRKPSSAPWRRCSKPRT